MAPRNKSVAVIEAREHSQCPYCLDPAVHVRSTHHLKFVANHGLDALRDHLRAHYAQKVDTERRDTYIKDLCDWIGGEIAQWSGFVDEDTG